MEKYVIEVIQTYLKHFTIRANSEEEAHDEFKNKFWDEDLTTNDSNIYMTSFSVLNNEELLELSEMTKFEVQRASESQIVVALNKRISDLENEIINLKK